LAFRSKKLKCFNVLHLRLEAVDVSGLGLGSAEGREVERKAAEGAAEVSKS
jgi:hypothetical protein